MNTIVGIKKLQIHLTVFWSTATYCYLLLLTATSAIHVSLLFIATITERIIHLPVHSSYE